MHCSGAFRIRADSYIKRSKMLRQRHIPLKEHKKPPQGGFLCSLFHVELFWMRFAEYTHFNAEDNYSVLTVKRIPPVLTNGQNHPLLGKGGFYVFHVKHFE
ncbi:MAG: hypothetical protein IKD39_03450 [Oscillospiraceae bacterium]|nr:hypothetical protein [Oscillospiraceae bacterium]